MSIRFLCDRNLGKLTKWLRILGYDTIWCREYSDQGFIKKAESEDRIVLTRKRNLVRSGYGRLIIVEADLVEDQICEIIDILALKPNPKHRMTLCLLCNVVLESITKKEVESEIPIYVYQSNELFRKCPLCRRIYWPGTHTNKINESIKMRIRSHPL